MINAGHCVSSETRADGRLFPAEAAEWPVPQRTQCSLACGRAWRNRRGRWARGAEMTSLPRFHRHPSDAPPPYRPISQMGTAKPVTPDSVTPPWLWAAWVHPCLCVRFTATDQRPARAAGFSLVGRCIAGVSRHYIPFLQSPFFWLHSSGGWVGAGRRGRGLHQPVPCPGGLFFWQLKVLLGWTE